MGPQRQQSEEGKTSSATDYDGETWFGSTYSSGESHNLARLGRAASSAGRGPRFPSFTACDTNAADTPHPARPRFVSSLLSGRSPVAPRPDACEKTE